jgi:D-arabinose 1-dehydrogenase-like Zn-dependent alcohol dehydrogenase
MHFSVSPWPIDLAKEAQLLTEVIPMVEVFPLEQAALAFETMMQAKAHFRSVLKMSHQNSGR